jgi:hypothetical protein
MATAPDKRDAPLPTNYLFIKKKKKPWLVPVIALIVLGAAAAFFLR